MNIPLTPCKSSNIRAHGYDAATKTLVVEFSNGGKYRYNGVPQDVYDGLAKADSPGAFFAKSVRASYQGSKVVDNG